MNARQFNFSFNEVEPANDCQCLNVQQNMKKWRTIRWGAAALAACLCVIVLVIVLPSLNHYTPQLQPSSASDNQNNVSPFEIAVGAEDDAKGKPTNPQHLSAATLSFCQGNNVSVTLGMGDLYSMHQACGGLPVLDTYGENGYPLLRVYEANPNQHTNGFLPEQPDSRLTINGVAGAGYEKIFLKNELNQLDISIQEVDGTGWRISNPEAWHHETLEIGFQEIEVNTSGTIIILFGWYFEHDNPSNAQESNHSIMGIARQLSYYKGEKGIGLSFAGTEDAEGNYLAAVKETIPNMDRTPAGLEPNPCTDGSLFCGQNARVAENRPPVKGNMHGGFTAALDMRPVSRLYCGQGVGDATPGIIHILPCFAPRYRLYTKYGIEIDPVTTATPSPCPRMQAPI